MSESNRPLDEDGILLAREPEEEARPDDRIDDERMDEENTLKPEFVRSVEDALDEGDVKAVYELVEPLHPADIADLLELFERDERYQLAAAITDLMTSEVVAELNSNRSQDRDRRLERGLARRVNTASSSSHVEPLEVKEQRNMLNIVLRSQRLQ